MLLKIIINSILGIVLIFIWSKFVDFHQLALSLKTVDISYSLIILLLIFLTNFARSGRLKLLLSGYKDKNYPQGLDIKLKDALMLTLLSQFLSFMIPIRAGELTKSVYLSTQFDLPVPKTLIWVFLDRFLDFWATLFLIGLLLIFLPAILPGSMVKLVIGLLILFTFLSFAIVKSEKFAKQLVEVFSKLIFIPRVRQPLVGFAHNIIEGFSIWRSNSKSLIGLFLITILAIILDSLIWFVTFKALGVNLKPLEGLMGSLLTALTFLVPAAPGYVGSVEAAALGVFTGILSLPVEVTTPAAVLFHITAILAMPIFGLTSLYFLKFDLSSVWKKLKRGKS